jgi:hypothetical protein
LLRGQKISLPSIEWQIRLRVREKLWNDHLGLPKAEIEDVVRDAVEKMM